MIELQIQTFLKTVFGWLTGMKGNFHDIRKADKEPEVDMFTKDRVLESRMTYQLGILPWFINTYIISDIVENLYLTL